MKCRACQGTLRPILDLGKTPLANAYAETPEEALSLDKYPLRLCTCIGCGFVQIDYAVPSEVLFSHYFYETPRAKSLASHYATLIGTIGDLFLAQIGHLPQVVFEMGSNNGAFLEAIQPSVKRVLGIEPSQIEASVPTARAFFTKETAPSFGKCDLFVARHSMAHLDDLRGTLEGVREVLTDDGWAVIENAYLRDTLQGGQFDQIYHEHMSYFGLRAMDKLFASVGLHLRHVLHADIHGGSIAMFASKTPGPRTEPLEKMIDGERNLPAELDAFGFQARVTIAGLREALSEFSTVDSYGATAKGNTLLNVVGARVRYAVDSTPSKQGRYLPGTGALIISEEQADGLRPDAYLLTAWNYAREILEKQDEYRRAGGLFIVPFPFPRLV